MKAKLLKILRLDAERAVKIDIDCCCNKWKFSVLKKGSCIYVSRHYHKAEKRALNMRRDYILEKLEKLK